MSVVVGEFKHNFLLWLHYMKMFGDSEINLIYETTMLGGFDSSKKENKNKTKKSA